MKWEFHNCISAPHGFPFENEILKHGCANNSDIKPSQNALTNKLCWSAVTENYRAAVKLQFTTWENFALPIRTYGERERGIETFFIKM